MALLALFDDLDKASDLVHARLGHGESTEAKLSLNGLLETEAQLQLTAAYFFAKRDQHQCHRHQRGGARVAHAKEQRAALLRLATRMRNADVQLGGVMERSRDALLAANEANTWRQTTRGRVPTATFVELSERVSYSNAAPCGRIAVEGAAKTSFFQGWGTPTPQQHMLAASRFAQPGAGASLAAVAAPASTCSCAMAGPQRAAEVPPPTAPLAPPAFTAVPQAERAPQREPVCLDLASDDDDDVLA